MIRVAAASSKTSPISLEESIRSISSLIFAGTVDLQSGVSDFAADVLIAGTADSDFELQTFADLPIPVVLLADAADSEQIESILRAGIRGVISLDATAQEIESAVQAAHAGLTVLAPVIVERLLPEPQHFSDESSEPLSSRELEVLDLLAEGLSNKLIAHRLSISEHTVKTHVAAIFLKLGASSRTEAVSRGIRRGLVML